MVIARRWQHTLIANNEAHIVNPAASNAATQLCRVGLVTYNQ